MNKKLIITIVIALCFVVALTVVSCNQWDTPYEQLNKDGNTVSVKFNINGGEFLETKDVTLIDVFNLNKATSLPNGQKSIVPIDPADDTIRGSVQTVSRTNHIFEGWYVTLVNADGSYTITTQKWNFGDSFVFDASKAKNAENPVLVLSARWIPFTEFNVYIRQDDGSFPAEPQKVVAQSMIYPTWNESNGRLTHNQYPTLENKTFEKAYFSSDMSEEITTNIQGETYFDEVANKFKTTSVDVYAIYEPFAHYKIHNASSFVNNANKSGVYEILADLDFKDTTWPTIFSSNTFTGKIYGNNHKFSNISATQSAYIPKDPSKDPIKYNYGLFGTIGSSATIEKLTIENSSFTIGGFENNDGVRSNYGIFAGKVENGATLTNVSLSNSKLLLDSGKGSMFDKVRATEVSQKYANLMNNLYAINLSIAENNSTGNITTSGLSVEFTKPNDKVFVDGIYNADANETAGKKSVSELFTISANQTTGVVTISPVTQAQDEIGGI